MDEARARRIQPHYIELFFRRAFERLGGRIARRERGRFEVATVPAALRQREVCSPRRAPIATRYERIAFDPEYARIDGQVTADVVAPGHPLFDAVIDETLDAHRTLLVRGTVLVDERPDGLEQPCLLVAVAEEVVDGRGLAAGKRFSHVFVDPDGVASEAGAAPYLDFAPLADERALDLARFGWLASSESAATRWIIEHRLPAYAAEIGDRVRTDLERTRIAVRQRLSAEINRLHSDAAKAGEDEAAGRPLKIRAATLVQRADGLEARLAQRLRELAHAGELTLKPPHVVAVALVLPRAVLDATAESEDGAPVLPPRQPKETREVERRAVDAVLAAERALGRDPVEQHHNNPGFDIASLAPDGHVIFLEVKGRIAGSDDFFVSYNEVLHGKNTAPQYRLALVSVSPAGAEHDEIRYLADPFARTTFGDFGATGITGKWAVEWARGSTPF